MISIPELSYEQLADRLGEKPFRGKQIYEWLKRGVFDFGEMTDLSREVRRKLGEEYTCRAFEEIGRRESVDGTVKILGRFLDHETVEAVLMEYLHGHSACISTQVGCKMGCEFCASAKSGFTRHLTAGEMLSEVYELTRIAGEKLSNLVLMGMGEPLDNYENVVAFLRRLTHPVYYGLSARSITISTCGLVDRMDALSKEGIPVTLALSLHNPFQEERERIMPIAKRYPVAGIMDAAARYFAATGRRVTLEYALIRGQNDTIRHAERLVKLIEARGKNAFHVNLIPLNNHELTELSGSPRQRAYALQEALEQQGINTTVRRELGSDIEAACGQLKNNWRNYG